MFLISSTWVHFYTYTHQNRENQCYIPQPTKANKKQMVRDIIKQKESLFDRLSAFAIVFLIREDFVVIMLYMRFLFAFGLSGWPVSKVLC